MGKENVSGTVIEQIMHKILQFDEDYFIKNASFKTYSLINTFLYT